MRENGIILGTHKTRPTAQALASYLDAEYSETTPLAEKEYIFVFRYGNSFAPLENHTHFLFNSMGAIKFCTNKPAVRARLLKMGIPCPSMYNSITLDEATYPLVARPTNHFKGKDFHLINSKETAMKFLKRRYYLQKFIHKKIEYRVFIFKHRIIEANIKMPGEGMVNDIIRDFANGWIFKWVTYRDIDKNLRTAAREATAIVGLDFAAIDCCISTDDKPYIFEVNSAPGLIPRKIAKLGDKLKEFMGDKGA